jgi:hypothetical protein
MIYLPVLLQYRAAVAVLFFVGIVFRRGGDDALDVLLNLEAHGNRMLHTTNIKVSAKPRLKTRIKKS